MHGAPRGIAPGLVCNRQRLGAGTRLPLAHEMAMTVRQWVGIPCSVGIGPTKTLAKLANFTAKKKLLDGSGGADLMDEDRRARALAIVPVSEVWGIGRASAAKLAELGVVTAVDLLSLNRRHIRETLTVVGERLAAELAGEACAELELEAPPQKGCAVKRSSPARQRNSVDLPTPLGPRPARAHRPLPRTGVSGRWRGRRVPHLRLECSWHGGRVRCRSSTHRYGGHCNVWPDRACDCPRGNRVCERNRAIHRVGERPNDIQG
jgi:hypothetical protein